MTITIDKGGKVRIDNVDILEMNNVDELRIKKQLKGTKEMTRAHSFSFEDHQVPTVKRRT